MSGTRAPRPRGSGRTRWVPARPGLTADLGVRGDAAADTGRDRDQLLGAVDGAVADDCGARYSRHRGRERRLARPRLLPACAEPARRRARRHGQPLLPRCVSACVSACGRADGRPAPERPGRAREADPGRGAVHGGRDCEHGVRRAHADRRRQRAPRAHAPARAARAAGRARDRPLPVGPRRGARRRTAQGHGPGRRRRLEPGTHGARRDRVPADGARLRRVPPAGRLPRVRRGESEPNERTDASCPRRRRRRRRAGATRASSARPSPARGSASRP